METIKHEPLVYRLYEYLKTNHFGKKNGIKRSQLAPELSLAWGVKITERNLRQMTSDINASGTLEKLVSTTHWCYMCETADECMLAIAATFKMAGTLLKKGHKMAKKVSLNGQCKIPMGKYYKETVEVFTAENDGGEGE